MKITIELDSAREAAVFMEKFLLDEKAKKKVETAVSSTPAPAPVVTAPVVDAPVDPMFATPTFTLDQISKAAMFLMDNNRRDELVEMIKLFGINSLVELPVDKFTVFASHLRAKGCPI